MAGEVAKLPRRSASAVLHIVDGEVESQIDGITLKASTHDTIAVPTHAKVSIMNKSLRNPAFLFQVDDAPMQRKLGFYEVLN